MALGDAMMRAGIAETELRRRQDPTYRPIGPGLREFRPPARYVMIALSAYCGSTSYLFEDLRDAVDIAVNFYFRRGAARYYRNYPQYECVYIRDRYTHKTVLDLGTSL